MSKDNRRLRVFVKHFVNPLLRNLAYLPRGPFALLRHVGQRSGKTYEIPMMVWPVKDGFMIVLTYGTHVDWLRNIQAAGEGSLLWHKQEYVFRRPEALDALTALSALPPFFKQILQLRGVHDFVKLPAQVSV